ncbi:hypothetical protein LUW77_10820 [Streptomyces radiopugnans]|nr:hypothetical protein LUW77_10820 [Streptomyces radiopugnans]
MRKYIRDRSQSPSGIPPGTRPSAGRSAMTGPGGRSPWRSSASSTRSPVRPGIRTASHQVPAGTARCVPPYGSQLGRAAGGIAWKGPGTRAAGRGSGVPGAPASRMRPPPSRLTSRSATSESSSRSDSPPGAGAAGSQTATPSETVCPVMVTVVPRLTGA